MALDREKVWKEFRSAVNMAPADIEAWLETENSRKVGFKAGGASESVGHASGRRIVGLLRKKKSDLSDDDYRHMRKVVGYVHRHRAQRPDEHLHLALALFADELGPRPDQGGLT